MASSKKNNHAKVTIKIPRPLYEKISQVIDKSGYNSVTDFVVYVLRDLMASRHFCQNGDLSPQELSRVKKQLQALGYLDLADNHVETEP